MIIACIVLSGLALLAAGTNLILFFVEKKRGAARQQAMLDYVDKLCDSTIDENEEYVKEFVAKFFDKERECFKTENNAFFVEFSKTIGDRFEQHQTEIDKLKSGVVPNYEAALAAANAVNDFNTSLSAIMNYDPIAAAKARRTGGDKEVG